MSTIDGAEIEEVTIDGDPVAEITCDGDVVWQAIVWIDDLEHQDFGTYWHIGDTGQATLPTIYTDGYDGHYRVNFPSSNPNNVYTDPNLWGNQSAHVENYFPTGEIAEFFFRPNVWNSNVLLRFYTGGYGTTHSDNQILIPFDGTDYWRIEYGDGSGSTTYWGSDPQEDGTFTITAGEWHRFVIDKSAYPDVSVYLWDNTGTLLSELHSTGGEDAPNDGLGWWWNPDTDVDVSKMNLIDASDI